jgi:hypothetical protein
MRMLARSGMVLMALLVALFLSANVYMIIDYWPDFDFMANYGLPHGSLATVVGTMMVVGSSLAFFLFILVLVLSETYSLRSLLFHLAAGVALLVLLRFDFASRFRHQDAYGLFDQAGLGLIATGAALGLIYWLLAGRKAGSWREAP